MVRTFCDNALGKCEPRVADFALWIRFYMWHLTVLMRLRVRGAPPSLIGSLPFFWSSKVKKVHSKASSRAISALGCQELAHSLLFSFLSKLYMMSVLVRRVHVQMSFFDYSPLLFLRAGSPIKPEAHQQASGICLLFLLSPESPCPTTLHT